MEEEASMDLMRCPTCYCLLPDPEAERCPMCRERLQKHEPVTLTTEGRADGSALLTQPTLRRRKGRRFGSRRDAQ